MMNGLYGGPRCESTCEATWQATAWSTSQPYQPKNACGEAQTSAMRHSQVITLYKLPCMQGSLFSAISSCAFPHYPPQGAHRAHRDPAVERGLSADYRTQPRSERDTSPAGFEAPEAPAHPRVRLVARPIPRCPAHTPRPRTSVPFTLNPVLPEINGKAEGGRVGYNLKKPARRSYHHLLCFEGHLQECPHGSLGPGNTVTATAKSSARCSWHPDVWRRRSSPRRQTRCRGCLEPL